MNAAAAGTPPARRRRRTKGPTTAFRKTRRAIRRPVWRWAFLATATAGWAFLGADVVVWLATTLALYAWWPQLRTGKGHRRRTGRR